jgi:hypothetical protein
VTATTPTRSRPPASGARSHVCAQTYYSSSSASSILAPRAHGRTPGAAATVQAEMRNRAGHAILGSNSKPTPRVPASGWAAALFGCTARLF